MIRILRKRHLQIWTLWAFLLPAAIVSAVVFRRQMPTVFFAEQQQPVQRILIREKVMPGYTLQLRGRQKEVVEQVVWHNQQPFVYPAAALYQLPAQNAPVAKGNYLGRIEGRGRYAFAISAQPVRQVHLMLYDFLHQKEIARIHFEP